MKKKTDCPSDEDNPSQTEGNVKWIIANYIIVPANIAVISHSLSGVYRITNKSLTDLSIFKFIKHNTSRAFRLKAFSTPYTRAVIIGKK